MPKVSIIIPVFNGANYLQEAIDSALQQDYENLEIIVINDGSTDEGKTEAIAKSYGGRIRYYYKKNGGVATALNYGIKVMAGEYFSWLSHDDIYKRNKISSEIHALETLNDKTQVICCGYDVVDANRNFLYTINPVSEYGSEKLKIPLFPVFRCCINGCGLLIHKSHFERVGVFDEHLPTTQDYDLWFRILRGKQMFFLEGSYFYSRSHDEQDSRRLYKTHIDECNALWIRLFNSLSLEEMCTMEQTPYQFFCAEFLRFRETDYHDVKIYLKKNILQYSINLKLDINTIKKHLDDLLDLYEWEIRNLKQHEESVIESIQDYREKYESLCNSTCWKITKPLRIFLDMIKR